MANEKLEKIIQEIIGEDIFWQVTVKKYFDEKLREKTEDEKILLLKNVALDSDVLNEFTKYLIQKTYDIKNAINLGGVTAKNIAEKCPEKNAIEVYIDLAKIKGDKEQEIIKQSIENSNFVFRHTKGSLLPNNKNLTEIIITDDLIYTKINGKVKINSDVYFCKKVFEAFSDYMEKFKYYSEIDKTLSHARGSSIDKITIKDLGKFYSIYRNVNNEESISFYDKCLSEVLEIINNCFD